VQNSAPTASGNLASSPFAHLLLYLQERGQGGTLHVRWGSRALEDAAWVYVEGGLVRRARVAGSARGLLEALVPLCARRDGSFSFFQTVDLVSPRPDALEGRLDPRALLTAALRQGARDDVVHAAIAPLGEQRLQLRNGAELEAYGFNHSEETLARLLSRGAYSLAELEGRSPLPVSMVRRLVYLLRATRAVAVLPAARQVVSGTVPRRPVGRAPSAPVTPPEPPPEARRRRVGRDTGEDAALRAPSTLPPPLQERWARIIRKAERIEQESCFEQLELPTDANREEALAAFDRLAGHYDPQGLPPELAPLTGHARKVHTLLVAARDTLVDPARRLEHMADLDAEREVRLARARRERTHSQPRLQHVTISDPPWKKAGSE
jgi:hypothetical protein